MKAAGRPDLYGRRVLLLRETAVPLSERIRVAVS